MLVEMEMKAVEGWGWGLALGRDAVLGAWMLGTMLYQI